MTRAERTRVLIADDNSAFQHQLRELLISEFEVTGAVSDGEALIEAARQLEPDVVITDFQMPKMDGLKAARRILKETACRAVVLLTMYKEPSLVKHALEDGILGYVLKSDAHELALAVPRVLQGEVYISSALLSTG